MHITTTHSETLHRMLINCQVVSSTAHAHAPTPLTWLSPSLCRPHTSRLGWWLRSRLCWWRGLPCDIPAYAWEVGWSNVCTVLQRGFITWQKYSATQYTARRSLCSDKWCHIERCMQQWYPCTLTYRCAANNFARLRNTGYTDEGALRLDKICNWITWADWGMREFGIWWSDDRKVEENVEKMSDTSAQESASNVRESAGIH